jgi:hypothetical protein
VAQFVTSKNAGPFLLTLDIVFADEVTYRTFKSLRPLDRTSSRGCIASLRPTS